MCYGAYFSLYMANFSSRFLPLISALLIAIAAHAEMSEKRMAAIIAKYDVADMVMNAPDAGSFWIMLQMTNHDYHRVAKSLAGNGDRDIKRDLIGVLSECHNYFTNVPTRPEAYTLMESLADSMGIRSTSPLVSFSVTDEPDMALFGYPNGYIFMTGALYDEIRADTLATTALLASEAAHYALQHAYAHSKWEKSRKRRQRFWRILGASALAATSVVADVASDGYVPADIGVAAAVLVAASPIERRYTMHYSPRQILEADIVAYRFMQWATGSGDSYIRALQLAGNDIDATSGFEGPDYPTVAERVALLRYMRDNPQLRDKVRANSIRAKKVDSYFNIFSPANFAGAK